MRSGAVPARAATASLILLAACASPPRERQASRSTTDAVAALVDRVGHEPVVVEISAGKLRDEVLLAATVDAAVSTALLPDTETRYLDGPLPPGTRVAAGEVVAVVTPVDAAGGVGGADDDGSQERIEIVALYDGIVVGGFRDLAIADPDDLAVLVPASAALPVGLEVGDTATFRRADDVGGEQHGVVAALPADDAPFVVIRTDAVLGASPAVPFRTDVVVRLLGPEIDGLLVPVDAVREHRGEHFLVVDDGNGERRRVAVELGAMSGGSQQVVGPVDAGARVVVP